MIIRTLSRTTFGRSSVPIISNYSVFTAHSVCYCSVPVHDQNQEETLVASPARIRKLIASESDPLLAKEIFDLASHQPNFCHTYATYHTLILKLGRAHHFSLMQSVLCSLKTQNYSIHPSLFSQIIQIYGDAGLPEKALEFFYKIIEFNIKPSPKHLNRILEILVAHQNFLRPAFELFKAAHKYDVNPNTMSYNILMRAFCLSGDLSIAYSLFGKMLKRDVMLDIESYKILIQGFCRKSQVNKAVDLLEDMFNKGFFPDPVCYSTLLNSLCRKKDVHIPRDTEIDKVEKIETDACFILLIEKECVFGELTDEQFYKRFPCILITGKGQPDLATKRFLRKLANSPKLPVLALVDGDIYGIAIVCTYVLGSRALSYDSEQLVTPKIKWLGVRPSDIEKYKIPEEALVKMKKKDTDYAYKKMQQLETANRRIWADEIRTMIKKDAFVGIEALDSLGIGFLLMSFCPPKSSSRTGSRGEQTVAVEEDLI